MTFQVVILFVHTYPGFCNTVREYLCLKKPFPMPCETVFFEVI